MSNLRLVFFGMNSRYSYSILRELAAQHPIIAVVESAPRKKESKDKSGQISASVLKKYSEENGIPYLYLMKNMDAELVRFLEMAQPDLGCVASFSQLISEAVMDVPRQGIINLHPSLLPKFRGPNPWLWVYIEMEKENGVTVHFIDEGEDTGDIILQERYEVPLGMPLEQMQAKALQLGARLMNTAINQIENATVERFSQREIKTFPRARNLKTGERIIDWQNWPIEKIYHVLAGGYPWLKKELPPNPLPLCMWKITGYEKMAVGGQEPGSLHFDLRGPFFSCRDGKIRIQFKLETAKFKKITGR